MIVPRILGFLAFASLVAAAVLGRKALRRDAGFCKAISVLAFCSVAGTITSYTRSPIVIWPLGLGMLASMAWLVWCLHVEQTRKTGSQRP